MQIEIPDLLVQLSFVVSFGAFVYLQYKLYQILNRFEQKLNQKSIWEKCYDWIYSKSTFANYGTLLSIYSNLAQIFVLKRVLKHQKAQREDNEINKTIQKNLEKHRVKIHNNKPSTSKDQTSNDRPMIILEQVSLNIDKLKALIMSNTDQIEKLWGEYNLSMTKFSDLITAIDSTKSIIDLLKDRDNIEEIRDLLRDFFNQIGTKSTCNSCINHNAEIEDAYDTE